MTKKIKSKTVSARILEELYAKLKSKKIKVSKVIIEALEKAANDQQ